MRVPHDSSAAAATGPSRPGGRSARVRDAVLAAALAEVAAHGYTDLSIGTVAERSGVHKTTIYRRWGSKETLLIAALESLADAPVVPTDTGRLETDLATYASDIIALLTGETGRVLRAVLGSDARRLAAVDDLRRGLFATRRPLSEAIFTRAALRGEVPDDTDANAAVDFLVAPLYFRLLLSEERLDDRLARQTARATSAAARAGAFSRAHDESVPCTVTR